MWNKTIKKVATGPESCAISSEAESKIESEVQVKLLAPESFSTFMKEGHHKRAQVVAEVVALFALLSHISFLLLFYFIKVIPMFFFNFFSVTLFLVVFFTLRRLKSFTLYYIICTTEVIVHQFFAVWYIGLDSSFHFFILLMGLIPFLALEDHRRLSIFFSIVCDICFMLFIVLLDNHVPIYYVSPKVIFALKYINISLTILLLGVIAMVFTISVQNAEKQAYEQYTRAEHLLCNILPDSIAEKLKLSDATIAESYESVSVLFLDIVNFTRFSSSLSAERLVDLLNRLFSTFDVLSDQCHVEKIKTIGDAYMVAAGLPNREESHCYRIADFGLRLLKAVANFNEENGTSIQVRIGIHSGPVVAGIIGIKKFIYDLWGSTVNYASRMESASDPDRIQVSEEVYNQLKDKFVFEKRSPMEIKGCGLCTCYFLSGRKDKV